MTSAELPSLKESSLPNNRLYEILEVKKDATDENIKRAYRKLALRYHPDKNPDGDPEKTERFKEINHANSVLSDSKKRKIYDQYGDLGLKMVDQFGERFMRIFAKPWLKWFILGLGCLTGGYFCCCCFCFYCCNFCCGKCTPQKADDTEYYIFKDNASSSAKGDSNDKSGVETTP